MDLAILLALAASFCTATSSVCQRLGARHLEANGHQVRGFDLWLVFRLATQPVWLLGFTAMIGGFVLQVAALHFGPLALVQPILAVELLFVFGYLAMRTRSRGMRWHEWLAAVAMSAGLSVFLRAASPSQGQPHAPALSWWLGGLATAAVAGTAVAASRGGSATRRAAFLGIATGVSWGFIAAVIKELSSHVDGGPSAIFTNWSVYVLMAAGAGVLLLTSHAMAAGPLAASQPGFTLGDPITAILLGAFLFGETLQTSPAALAAEVLGLAVLALGVWVLSRSDLITGPAAPRPPRPPRPPQPGGPVRPAADRRPETTSYQLWPLCRPIRPIYPYVTDREMTSHERRPVGYGSLTPASRSRTASPYLASLASPTPLISDSSASVAGRAVAIARSVAFWKTV